MEAHRLGAGWHERSHLVIATLLILVVHGANAQTAAWEPIGLSGGGAMFTPASEPYSQTQTAGFELTSTTQNPTSPSLPMRTA